MTKKRIQRVKSLFVYCISRFYPKRINCEWKMNGSVAGFFIFIIYICLPLDIILYPFYSNKSNGQLTSSTSIIMSFVNAQYTVISSALIVQWVAYLIRTELNML